MVGKKRISIFAFLLALTLFLSTTAYAAQDFIVENKTSALFIVNGTTGNIILNPNFGKVTL